jgi:hypothetical protein
MVEGDIRPSCCRIPKSPDKDNAAADVEGKGEASPCSAVGTAEVSSDSTVCVLVAVDVAVAWATAAAWPLSPPGLMLCGGGVNGVSVVADADTPA